MALAKKSKGGLPGISQEELVTLLRDRERLAELKRAVTLLAKDVESRERDLIGQVQEHGKSLKVGRFVLAIALTWPRCSPSWKGAFRELAARVGLSPDKEEARVVEESASQMVQKQTLEIVEL